MFINLNAKEQISVTIVAPTADFERIRTAALGVLRSWQMLPAL